MTTVRLSLLAALVVLFSGCASQVRTGNVGQRGPVDETRERTLAAELQVSGFYDSRTPKTGAMFESSPPGAQVEWFDNNGRWITVGTTPSLEIVIEATGKPELFRVSMPGYLSQTRWVAATRGSRAVRVGFAMQRELPYDRFVLSESR